MIRLFGWTILTPAETRQAERESARTAAELEKLNAAVERSRLTRARAQATIARARSWQSRVAPTSRASSGKGGQA